MFFHIFSASYKKIISILLLICTFCVLSLFFLIPIRGQTDISEIEQRSLSKFPIAKIDTFLEGSYQNEVESSISDQLIFSQEIKLWVRTVFNKITFFVVSFLPLKEYFVDEEPKTFVSDNTIQSSISEMKDDNTYFIDTERTDQNENINTQKDEKELKTSEKITDSETLKTQVSSTKKAKPAYLPSTMVMTKGKYTYIEVLSDKIYRIDDSGSLIRKPLSPNDFNFIIYDSKMLERVTYPKYLYFINTSENIDFNNISGSNAFAFIKNQFKMDGYAQLSFRSFNEYKKFFYQTDHHWNKDGSYLGYTQILRMLEGGKITPHTPTGNITYNTIFNGTFAREALLDCSKEKFSVYLYTLPEFVTFIDDKKETYGFRYMYKSENDCPNKKYTNHYGLYYGDDHAKVVYKFNNPNAPSLLILATSYSNAVNELIASHYNETHVLDFRYYSDKYGKEIDAQSYMEENGLSKLLIIGDISSLGYRKRESSLKGKKK